MAENKDFTLIVNTREKKWEKETISYKEVIVLAFGSYEDNENITYTVDYLRGPKENPEGSLTKGKSVEVKNQMIFNVTKTHKS
jgi:Multiubiquitin